MRVSWVRVVFAAIASGCATGQAVQVRGPDGDPNWISISCARDPTDCYVLAGQSCPSGYDFGGSSLPARDRHALVKCRVAAPVAKLAEPAVPNEPVPAACHGAGCRSHNTLGNEDPAVSGPQRPE